MSTKLLNNNTNYSKISEGFNDIFKFDNEKDKLELDSKIISAKFLSEIQISAEKKGIKNRKDLAKLIGTSASYLTQLYRGNKVLNLLMLAKIQKALNIKFEISLNYDYTKNHLIEESNIAENINEWFYNSKTKDYIKIIKRKNPKRKNLKINNDYSSYSKFELNENS